MTIRVTITKAGRFDSYGQSLAVGTTYTVGDDFGIDLIGQGFALDTDSILGLNLVLPYMQYQNRPGLPMPNNIPPGLRIPLSNVISQKTDITNGAIQTAEQVIGRLPIPAGALGVVGTVFRALVTLGRNDAVDAYGSNTNYRFGRNGVVGDIAAGGQNISSLFPAASGGVSTGAEAWWRVVSVGANSVIEKLGIGNGGSSWTTGTTSAAAVAAQYTLTGYNLATQPGFMSFTTDMATATTTFPRTGFMRLEIMP